MKRREGNYTASKAPLRDRVIAPRGGSKGGMAMRYRTSLAILCVAPLLMALGSPSEQKETAKAEEPRYDTSTNVDMMVVVADVKEVAAGNPLDGLHLLVRPEMAKTNAETTDVYLGPDDYLKDFDCHFAKGDRIQVKGSKVKFNGATAILAREVRLEATTVYLRDDRGVPYWKKS